MYFRYLWSRDLVVQYSLHNSRSHHVKRYTGLPGSLSHVDTSLTFVWHSFPVYGVVLSIGFDITDRFLLSVVQTIFPHHVSEYVGQHGFQ